MYVSKKTDLGFVSPLSIFWMHLWITSDTKSNVQKSKWIWYVKQKYHPHCQGGMIHVICWTQTNDRHNTHALTCTERMTQLHAKLSITSVSMCPIATECVICQKLKLSDDKAEVYRSSIYFESQYHSSTSFTYLGLFISIKINSPWARRGHRAPPPGPTTTSLKVFFRMLISN